MTDTPTAPDNVREAARDVYERTECAAGCCGDVNGAIDMAYTAGRASAAADLRTFVGSLDGLAWQERAARVVEGVSS